MTQRPPAPWPNFLVDLHAFDEHECNTLVDLGRATQIIDGTEDGGIEGVGSEASLRRTSVAWIPRDTDTEWVFARLEALSERANETWRLDIDGIEEDLQFTEYNAPGAHYTWHHDGLETGVEDRKMSLVVQLSDPEAYNGADLEFLEVATDYAQDDLDVYRSETRSRGSVISFCSFEYHRVTPLRSGIRHSLVAWVSGPRLR